MRIDLQTHTRHSPACGWMSPRSLVEAAVSRGLDGVAVTDHNTTDGWAGARRHAPEGLVVIPGEEIDTRAGQVIGLFLEERIAPGGSVRETIEAIHAQGGLAVAPHPCDRFRDGLDELDPYADALDAVEVLNARCLLPRDNRRAADFATEADLPAVGGSDGHFAREVGAAHTVVDVDVDVEVDGVGADSTTVEAIADAIRAGRTRPAGGRSSPINHAGTIVVKRYNWVERRFNPRGRTSA